MAFNLGKTLTNFFTKSQKAQYVVAKRSANEKTEGEPIPNSYSPEIRERLYKTPIVFMAINTIAEQVAKVDWEIVPKKSILEQFGYGTSEGKSTAVLTRKEWAQFKQKYTGADRAALPSETKQHIEKVYGLLNNPNDNQENFTSIIKKVVTDLKIHDAAAIEKTKNGIGEVAEIYTAPGPYVKMSFDKNGKLLSPAYYQQDKQMSANTVASWNKDELIYFMLNPLSTSMYGVSPIDVIAQTVATLINALNYNGTYFESGALPEGFFTLSGLTEVTAKRLMQKWEEQLKGKHHKVLFMPDGATWHPFRFNNVEMQWLEGQKFYMDIAMAVLGVTKNELGFTETVNKSEGEQQSFVFKNKTLIPTLNLLANKINQELIGKDGFGFEDVMFVYKNVDLADKETMDKIHDRAVKSGRMTINEAREESGLLPYVETGDAPVIATSQGLVFLEQFQMQFEDYQEERNYYKEEAKKRNITIAQVKAEINQATQQNAAGNNANNSDKQPKTPPSAPKADEKPKVDESKSIAVVAGLEKIADKIDAIIKTEHEK